MHIFKHSLIFLTSLCFLICPSLANAQTKTSHSPLTKSQFEKLLPGKTIKGEYRFMRERTKTYNFSEYHHKNGSTRYTEGKIKSNGLWYVLGERKICYKYPDSPEMGDYISCFWVYRSEGCYYGYSLEQMGLKGPRNYDDWIARWVLEGSGASCAEALS